MLKIKIEVEVNQPKTQLEDRKVKSIYRMNKKSMKIFKKSQEKMKLV